MGFIADRNCRENEHDDVSFHGHGKARNGTDASRKQRSRTRRWMVIGGGHLMSGRHWKGRAAIMPW